MLGFFFLSFQLRELQGPQEAGLTLSWNFGRAGTGFAQGSQWGHFPVSLVPPGGILLNCELTPFPSLPVLVWVSSSLLMALGLHLSHILHVELENGLSGLRGCPHPLRRAEVTQESGAAAYDGWHVQSWNFDDISIAKAMVFPVVMYRCESWTIKKAEGQELMLSNWGAGKDS